jgi:hypothetical protein
MAEIFRSFAQGGHGSGFVITDSSGENYIITNSHVVAHAEKVNVEIQKYDGTIKTYTSCPIVYLDDELDLAVLRFPNKEKVFKEGFIVDSRLQVDGTEIWAAGYPGLLGKPGWQLTKGTISNQQAQIEEMIDPKVSYIIQHTASIDPGNSGSPLLLKDNKSPIGYRVIGVNTWTVGGRQNAFFALPAKNITLVLERMKKAEHRKADPQAHKESLKRICKILASELGSEHPNFNKVRQYVSYTFVDEVGLESFSSILKVSDDKEREEWEDYFFLYSPIEAMRSAIYVLLWNTVRRDDEKVQVEFKEINFADEETFMQNQRIRTIFKINNQEREIVWSYESGEWRIVNMKLTQIDRAYDKESPITAGKSSEKGVGIGISGSVYVPETQILSKIGIFVDIPLFPFINIIPGFNYVFHMDYRSSAASEDSDWVELYALFKTGYVFDFDSDSSGFFISPFIAIGTGVNYLLKEGSPAVIPFIIQTGVEIGFSHFSLGLYVMYNTPLIDPQYDDWYAIFYKYSFPYLGVFVKYYF